jgi:hypothetical protein
MGEWETRNKVTQFRDSGSGRVGEDLNRPLTQSPHLPFLPSLLKYN